MVHLTPDECRVLGVLVEKAQTTPAQYPLTLNSLTVGCNQKNNRFPLTNFDDDRVFDAVDSLRAKGLVREAMLSGSRVAKYRHLTREVLNVTTQELVLLAELLLRGPQSIGELRGNAARMHPIESLDVAQTLLTGLMTREEPLVRELPPPPGSRARRYAQLLCPDLHPLDASAAHHGGEHDPHTAPPAAPGAPAAADRLARLETDVARLQDAVRTLAAKLGEPDPL